MLKAPLANSTLFLGVFAASLIWLSAAAIRSIAGPPPGRIIGNLDGISQDGDHFFISGWACQQGQNKSLTVHVYGADPKTPSQRSLLIVQFADLYSEPAIAQACQDSGGGGHRFVIMLPHGYGPESLIWVNGIRLIEGVANDAVAGSGQRLARLPVLDAPPAGDCASVGRCRQSECRPLRRRPRCASVAVVDQIVRSSDLWRSGRPA